MTFFKRSIQLVCRRSIHTQDWTRESLNKIKKTELLQLARDHDLKDIKGSKNEMIDQLLDAKEVDIQWVGAFENKVAHRGHTASSHKRKVVKGPHPMNDAIFKRSRPQVITIEEPVIEQLKETEEMDEDIHKEWVEAFQMKVSSRGSRSRKFKEVSFDTSVNKPLNTPLDIPLEKTVNKSSGKTVNKPLNKTSQRPALNTLIGSSLLLWYVGGQDAFIKIWEFIS